MDSSEEDVPPVRIEVEGEGRISGADSIGRYDVSIALLCKSQDTYCLLAIPA